MTIAVHVLTWMALERRNGQEIVTSERVAGTVNTQPVVIRRCLGQLRNGRRTCLSDRLLW
jgi:DNA-binding IscR family transcriptional regulator